MALKVLAVDDSLTIRELLRACLTNAGFDVDVAVDGMDGLEKLPEAAPDVVITDINMPRMNGFEFIDALRGGQSPTTVPILVLTTESASELKQKARAAGATGWIVKPFDETRLVSAIRRVASYDA
ncbi:response regulator [Poseidonocella sedimentorum]|uniref:Two-component system, chemotaxis family, response regulator CheY n=1 Tax=Poseidonocella sedimentorum TaxID=871652 RepID=A0A1I6EI38_9RHOB|nr:response regulator [Poseidonocella sedimentorum]SFR17178.1 two-component system, chemotaxis family, response regulator CheY [Poseidonocella sedimentorum]